MPQATTEDAEKPVRPSPYSPLGILRQALASPNVRRGATAVLGFPQVEQVA
ncbi:hypothetical protein [Nostoc sp.]|uniref:hypothetical protein n=1 Tax=Nostoc sp. TaxID=1180 RepID=UPI002FFA28DC